MDTKLEQPSPRGFWDRRIGWSKLKQVLFLEPLPGGARWTAAFGSLLLFVFALQVVTGILLTLNYAPSVETAWPSVRTIEEDVPLGSFIRGVHHWGSSAMVVLLLFHLLQVFVWGAYKTPREFTWMTGVLLLACVLALAFTGYLLPWDQKAYWATKVGLGMASTVPVVGEDLRTLLQGGPQMGNLTLTRFFTLHGFVLPGLIILLIVVHLYLFRLHGVTPSWWQSAAQLKSREEPFWPRQVLMDALLALAFLVGLGLWAVANPAPLETQADPAQRYEARPEWYFMFLFQLLRYFEGPYEVLGTFVLPTLFFLILLLWPWLDRNPHRNPWHRPVAMTLLGAATASLIGLTIFAITTDVRMREPVQAVAPATAPAPAAGPIQRADVARLYHAECAACHGVDGSAREIRAGLPTIPDFTSMAWQLSRTELEIMHRIQDGNEPLMPAYRDKLTPSQMIALTVYVRAFATAPEPAAPAPQAPPPKQAVPIAAQMPPDQVYRAYCLACHDGDGRGKTVRSAMPDIPDFTDKKWQSSRPDAQLQQAISDGKGKFMVPMKDKLGPTDIAQMVAYVRTFQEGKQVIKIEPAPVVPPHVPTGPAIIPGDKPSTTKSAAAESAARVRVATDLYRQYCLTCHGVDGRGLEMKAAMPGLPDFTSAHWQDRVSNPQMISGILEGKGTLMPAFRGRVSEDQARALAAYLRAFGPAHSAPIEASSSDFEDRYRELDRQWHELQRQLNELARPPR
jgi:ubiquinol-cytochrome c reductase cytochrome b subunit